MFSPGGVAQDTGHVYMAEAPQLNDWSLAGNWTIGNERAQLNDGGGSIIYRFHATICILFSDLMPAASLFVLS